MFWYEKTKKHLVNLKNGRGEVQLDYSMLKGRIGIESRQPQVEAKGCRSSGRQRYDDCYRYLYQIEIRAIRSISAFGNLEKSWELSSRTDKVSLFIIALIAVD